MNQQVYARDLVIGDILADCQRTIEDIAIKPNKVVLALSGRHAAILRPDDVVSIVARYIPASQNK